MKALDAYRGYNHSIVLGLNAMHCQLGAGFARDGGQAGGDFGPLGKANPRQLTDPFPPSMSALTV